MKGTLSKLFIFAVGAAVGSAVTYKLLDKKLRAEYEERIENELDELREYYLEKGQDTDEIDDIGEDISNEPENDVINRDIRAYAGIIEKNQYVNPDENERMVNEVEKPYIIEADEYGEYADYDMENLVYYADGVLADMGDNVIDDFESIVGSAFIDKLDSGEDTVFVRNDRKMTDYEIQSDDRDFEDAVGDE